MRAMILAAGRGERMRPLTDAKPKSLLRAGGKPLIAWMIERLASAGVHEFVINHAYLGQMIEEELGDGARFGVRIAYSPEKEALETAGGIAKALQLLGDEPFIAAAADIYSDFDFTRMVARSNKMELAHLVLVPNPLHHPEGDFALDGERVLSDGPDRLTFSAMGLYRPELFAGIAPGSRAQLAPLLRHAMDHGRVSGEVHRGEWRDIGTPQRLADLERDLANAR
jgi:N-acetyl-alpha-D-muramate 1-phosphate uridylyltransferase